MMERQDLPAKHWNGRLLDALLQVLDRQIHDHDGKPMGTVDDIDFDGLQVGEDISPGTSPPEVAALVSGMMPTTRILGGRPPSSRLQFIGWEEVDEVGVVLRLRPTTSEPDTLWVERWLQRYFIGRIPGGRHAPE